MKKIKYIIYSLPVLLTMLSGCTTTTDPAEAYKGQTADEIFQGGEAALHNRSYAEAVKRFEALDVQFPYNRHAEIAQLHIIYAYYKNSDYLSAETAADRFIHTHPTSPYVDYAYYMRGLSNYYQNLGVFERLFAVDYATRDLTQIKKSFNDFASLERQFPQSRYAPAAHQYMVYLRNVLANHQIEVAQFYFDHKAYAAAANRASIVVQNYQGAPVVPDALVLMAKSYYQLNEPQLAEQVIQVIRYNYPNTRYYTAVSQAQIANTRFNVVLRKENPIKTQPLSDTPVATVSYNSHVTNAQSGSMKSIGWFAKSVGDTKLFETKSPPLKPSVVNAKPIVNTASISKTPVPKVKESSKASSMSLAKVWNSISHAEVFQSQQKPAVSKPVTKEPVPAPELAETGTNNSEEIQPYQRKQEIYAQKEIDRMELGGNQNDLFNTSKV